ncbi:MAG: PHP domain-containing protein, partial [Clostridiales bacterium]|nr:PHP domain-containing protein [Clostridiales bacterium]
MSDKSTRTLSEIFAKIAPTLTGVSRDLFLEAEDVRLKVSREARIAEVSCALPRLYRKQDIYALEAKIKDAYDLAQVRILTRYDPALFTMDYMSEILAEAGRVGVVCNGFFDRYELAAEGERITVSIPFSRGGIGLLDLAQTARVIEGILYSEFGLHYEISIEQSKNADEEHAEFLSRQLERLNATSAEILTRYEQAEAAPPPETESAPAEEEKTKLPRVDSLFDGSPTAEDLGDAKIRSGRITFDCAAPEVVFGELFPIENVKPLRSIKHPERGAVILCEVFAIEQKETRRGDKVMFTIAVTDREASIYIKITVPADAANDTESLFSKGKQYAVRGTIRNDKFDDELYMQFTDILKVKEAARMDRAPEKRVELHLHTVMSAMDATNKADDIVNTAYKWGHKAVAITDHGNLQSFPVAMLTADKLEEKIKVLYGVEAYYVDDTARAAYRGEEVTFDDEFAVFDLETTGLSAASNKITEIGAVILKNGEILDRFNT